MVTGNYVTIETVIEKAQRRSGIDYIDYENAVEWSAELYGLLGLNALFAERRTDGQNGNPMFIHVSNYTALIPTDMVSLIDCSRAFIDTNGKPAIVPMIYSMGLEHDYANRYSRPPAYANVVVFENTNDELTSQTVQVESSIDGTSMNIAQQQALQYHIRNGVINTSFMEGDIVLTYLGYPMDENGSLLIPDHDAVQNAFVWNIIKNIDMLAYRKDPNNATRAIMEKSEQEYCWAVGKAHGKVHMPNADQMESLKNMLVRSIPHLNEHSNGFATANIQERRYGQVRVRN